MAIIDKERFVEIATNKKLLAKYAYPMLTLPGADHWTSTPFYRLRDAKPIADRDTALKVYEQVKTAICKGTSQQKDGRPWNFYDKPFSTLDRSEPWWGFEFECGFISAAARATVLSHVWDEWDGVTFDGEGEGPYPSEITFVPAEVSKFSKRTAPAYKFMKYLCDSGLTRRTKNTSVGTHLNISHPLLRNNAPDAAEFLNATLSFLSDKEKLFLFGRERLYSGCFYRCSNNSSNRWIELKVFRTTYDWQEWLQYIRTCHAITAVLDYYLRAKNKAALQNKGVSNLYDMVKRKAAIEVEHSDKAKGSQVFGGY